MKQEISDYYREKGFSDLYVNINKEPRRVATLRRPDGSMTSMSYAKYLYTSYHKIDIEDGYQVDHINNDKMDDRIENLQILSAGDNTRKSAPGPIMVDRICPVCKKSFKYRKRNLYSHPNPCCSRHCGGIKSRMIQLGRWEDSSSC